MVFSFSLLKTKNFKRKRRSIKTFCKAQTWKWKFIKNKEQESSHLFPSLPPTCTLTLRFSLFFRHVERLYYSSFYWRQHLPLQLSFSFTTLRVADIVTEKKLIKYKSFLLLFSLMIWGRCFCFLPINH